MGELPGHELQSGNAREKTDYDDGPFGQSLPLPQASEPLLNDIGRVRRSLVRFGAEGLRRLVALAKLVEGLHNELARRIGGHDDRAGWEAGPDRRGYSVAATAESGPAETSALTGWTDGLHFASKSSRKRCTV